MPNAGRIGKSPMQATAFPGIFDACVALCGAQFANSSQLAPVIASIALALGWKCLIFKSETRFGVTQLQSRPHHALKDTK
jgi:hypothetical protein